MSQKASQGHVGPDATDVHSPAVESGFTAEQRRLIENTQLFLLKCGWPSTGEDFFEALARYLAEALEMDFVCIDRLSGDRLSARTLAMYFDGKFEDSVAYTLKDTPCGDVVGETICSFHSGVRHLFPNDTVLQGMAAEGYVGTTLWSSQGQPIGLIALISRKPLVNLDLVEWVLRLAAIRAAGELERKQAEDELHRLNRTLIAHNNSSRAMMRAEDEAAYLDDVCRTVVQDCGHAMVWIGYAENDEYKSVRPVAYSGFEVGYLETLKVTWADTERGRGPTGTAIRTGRPSTCRNMLADPEFEPWREEALKRGYASSIVFPLLNEGKAFGAITIYSRDPDPFSDEEVALLSSLADDLSHGIGAIRLRAKREQTEAALRQSEGHLRLFVEHAPVALALFDTQMRYVAASRRWKADYGVEDIDVSGRSHYEVFPEISEAWKAVHRRCLAGAAERADEDRFERADGTVQWVRWEALPWQGDDDAIGGIIIFSEDITERKHAEGQLHEARAEAERRAAELESFMSNLADGVSVMDQGRGIVWMNDAGRAILHVPPEEAFADWMSRYELLTLDGTPLPVDQSVGSRALRGERVNDFRYVAVTPSGDTIILSASASPVFDSDGRVIGATSTFRDQAERVAFENEKQRLLDREHRIAEVLQRAINPPEVPSEMMGYAIAVRYRPALNEAEIGGDFYDVFELGDGRIAVLIGDVVGKGLAAAIRVAAARHSIRSYAYLDPRPARVLTLANEALCRDRSDESQMLTVFYAVLDPGIGGITYASAGHEPPIICRTGSACQEIEAGGVPLGLMRGVRYEQSGRRLEPGDIVVMVTDGITEARAPKCVLYGKEGLLAFIEQNRGESLEEVAEGIMQAATEHAGGQLQDDAAVVVFARQVREAET